MKFYLKKKRDIERERKKITFFQEKMDEKKEDEEDKTYVIERLKSEMKDLRNLRVESEIKYQKMNEEYKILKKKPRKQIRKKTHD